MRDVACVFFMEKMDRLLKEKIERGKKTKNKEQKIGEGEIISNKCLKINRGVL